MIFGNIELNSPVIDKGNFVCHSCFENFEESGVLDDSFDDHFGTVSCYSSCCPHCGDEDYTEGKVWLNKQSIHTASKDHFDKHGNVKISKGDKYKATFIKGYYIDENGLHKGLYEYTKRKLCLK